MSLRKKRLRQSRPVAFIGTLAITGLVAVTLTSCFAPPKYTIEEISDGLNEIVFVDNPGSFPSLSYSAGSGFGIIEENVEGSTVAFKDTNGNEELDVWEDWRETPQVRAEALAAELSQEQLAAAMLNPRAGGAASDGVSDEQRALLETYVRNLVNDNSGEVEANVQWNNAMQAYVEELAAEGEPYYPITFTANPRSYADVGGAFFEPGGDQRSGWPSTTGLAATFDPQVIEDYARIVSEEYRADGVHIAISPQIDLATDPRWGRVAGAFGGTFGENPELAAELGAAYVHGFQTTYDENGEELGWGSDSVNAQIKHWPGDGAGEGGRESHSWGGKYAVFPGDQFDTHVSVFEASIDAATVMPAYSIAVDGNGEPLFGEAVGTIFDQGRMGLLRDELGYEGQITTDWGVTDTEAYGMEHLTVEEQHFAILLTGTDMYGGNDDVAPVLAAWDLWQEAFEAGEVDIDAEARFRESSARTLVMHFQIGHYDDPYISLDHAVETIGSEEAMNAGNEAQMDSIVMLKNEDGVIASANREDWAEMTVYIPRTYGFASASPFADPEYVERATMNIEVAEEYFGAVVTDEPVLDANGQVESYVTPDLSDVDLVMVGMESPNNGTIFTGPGYDREMDSYFPISLQYRPYTADGPNVRQVSISGDILPDGTRENRAYFGQTSRITNEADLDAFERAVTAVEESGRDIPIITMLKLTNPVVPAEFEPASDAILAGFQISDQAFFEVALGLHEPGGRLPLAFPLDMDAVEAQLEDVPEDMDAYLDSVGNEYLFGFGLNWSGRIE